MSSKLNQSDIEFLSGLVTAEINRVVDARLADLRTEIAQTFVNVALNQLQMFGIELKPVESNGQGPHES